MSMLVKCVASIVVSGSATCQKWTCKVAMPGGCAIGKRPIDLHLKGFQALGAKIIQKTAISKQLRMN